MKTIKTHLRVVAFFFSVAILFQGCTVYKSSGVSFDEAVRAETKVKIKTKDNQTLKFKRLEFVDEQYFGIKESYKDDAFNIYNKEIIKTPLDISNIERIKIKDKTMSTILPFAIPVVLLGALIIGYSSSTW